MHKYFHFFAQNTKCALVAAQSEEGKHHSGWLEGMWNACTSDFFFAHGNRKNEIR